MSDLALGFVSTLAGNTIWLAATALVAAGVMRITRSSWPAAHRTAWLVTLAVGWVAWQLNVSVPWYHAQTSPAGVVSEAFSAVEVSPVDLATVDLETADTAPQSSAHARTESFGVSADAPTDYRLAQTVEIGPLADSSIPLAVETPSPRVEPAPASVLPGRFGGRSDWPLALLAVWLAGVILLPAAWLAGYARFVRRLPQGREATPAWQREWSELLASHKLRRAIPLRVTDELGPMMCLLPSGYELVVPEALWSELEPSQRRAILRHELSHRLRGDVWTSLVARALALPHWFNPLAWYAVRRYEEAAEWSCDLAATADVPATTYAKALVRLGETCGRDPLYGTAASGHSLAARVRRVLLAEQREDSRWKKAVLIAAVALLAAAPLVRVQLVAREPQLTEGSPQADGSPSSDVKATQLISVVAMIEGTVSDVLVENGDVIERGQVLVKLKNDELRKAVGTIEKQISVYQARLDDAKARGNADSSRAVRDAGMIKSLHETIAQLQQRIALLDVRSPANGMVVGQRLKETLAERPVEAGQVLLTLAASTDDIGNLASSQQQTATSRPPGYSPPEVTKEQLAGMKQAVDDAAKEYDVALGDYEAAKVPVEVVYGRSLRWKTLADRVLRAENVTDNKELSWPTRAHLYRMRHLQKRVNAHYMAGLRRSAPVDRWTIETFVEEAEKQLVRAEAGLDSASSAMELDFNNGKLAGRDTALVLEHHGVNRRIAILTRALTNDELPTELRAAIVQQLRDATVEGHRIMERYRAVIAQTDLQQASAGVTPKAAVVPDSSKATTADQPSKAATTSMVDEAGKAYQAMKEAFEAQNSPVSELYVWSWRWMRAAEDVATGREQRVVAVRAHLDRMREIQQKIKALHEAESRGGEAKELHAANYYVAEAERMLAMLVGEKQAEKAQQPAIGLQTGSMDFKPVVAARSAQPSPPASAPIDLEIKIVELEGQLNAAVIDAEGFRASYERAKTVAATEQQREQYKRDIQRAEAAQTNLKQQLELYRQKLKEVQTASEEQNALRKRLEDVWRKGLEAKPATPAAQPAKADFRPAKATAEPTKPRPAAEPAKAGTLVSKAEATLSVTKPKLLYEGKDYDQWASDLRTDLSPVRRREAVLALTAFAMHGDARQIATTILDAMQQYSFKVINSSEPEGKLKVAFVEFFGAIPAADATAVIVEALKSDQPVRKQAALGAAEYGNFAAIGSSAQFRQTLRPLLKDTDNELRRSVAAILARDSESLPEIVPMVREGLESERSDDVLWALNVLRQAGTSAAYAVLAPDLVRLTEGQTTVQPLGGGVNSISTSPMTTEAQVKNNAGIALYRMGKSALPELEKALQSAPDGEKEYLRRWHETLQKRADKNGQAPASRR
jgi:hypothetical protein